MQSRCRRSDDAATVRGEGDRAALAELTIKIAATRSPATGRPDERFPLIGGISQGEKSERPSWLQDSLIAAAADTPIGAVHFGRIQSSYAAITGPTRAIQMSPKHWPAAGGC